ncbi:Universal stress protein [Marine Group I thaumarchaeote SCGC AAA799-E16]|uniref:Universal stress protein n=4 Tax=Marine Group I TaxID=905826 RepID=A0A081RMT9_9ARCH|nr:Universal stress protein [Marine Group I thaumarchaeote SCGC AAA799-N04]KER05628.1 Universal stress protein [Marine Group I thaumarchaeote SCGC AAA799-E16]KFM15566.1 Universal stress protein [Marine Group I thaumarchaeote SCGC AAA799-D11]KFM16766.1 UspA domain-containing protein [Marine Group I thaumarchaeote SCGC RSA3]
MTDFKHVLVPFDGSENGIDSIETASKIAGNLGGKITILKCVEKKIPKFLFFKTKQDKLDAAIEVNAAENEASKFRNIAKKYGANATTEIKKIDDNPHQHIIDYANRHDVDLVVMSPSKDINTTEIYESIVDKISKNINCSLLRLQ